MEICSLHWVHICWCLVRFFWHDGRRGEFLDHMQLREATQRPKWLISQLERLDVTFISWKCCSRRKPLCIQTASEDSVSSMHYFYFIYIIKSSPAVMIHEEQHAQIAFCMCSCMHAHLRVRVLCVNYHMTAAADTSTPFVVPTFTDSINYWYGSTPG